MEGVVLLSNVMHPDVEKIIISQEQIQNRVKELGRQLTEDYRGKELVVIGILRGAAVFLADLFARSICTWKLTSWVYPVTDWQRKVQVLCASPKTWSQQ